MVCGWQPSAARAEEPELQTLSLSASAGAGFMRGAKVERDIVSYTLFVSFFPHLIAGPIVRHNELVPQFAEDPLREGLWQRFGTGLILFTLGLAKKVLIADTVDGSGAPVASSHSSESSRIAAAALPRARGPRAGGRDPLTGLLDRAAPGGEEPTSASPTKPPRRSPLLRSPPLLSPLARGGA